ncbi:hypothetical protein CONPUDRAFT_19217, partial [Coniophora puteana RWD-64-598 SS2]
NVSFSPNLKSQQVWSAFYIYALLCHHHAQGTRLVVPHEGEQHKCFNAAMKQRNLYIVNSGQDELPHYCDLCMRMWRKTDSTGKETDKCQMAVSDGITIGHYICKTFRCTKAPISTREPWCEQCKKENLADLCTVVGCNWPIVMTVQTKKTCDDEEHRTMEVQSSDRAKLMFALKSRLARSRTSRPEATVDDTALDGGDGGILDDTVDWFDLDEDGNINHKPTANPTNIGVPDAGPKQLAEAGAHAKKPKRMRILLGRRRSYCEVTIVHPCGVILARSTFYGAEAVSNVLIMVKKVFSLPGAQKPDFWVYDTACEAKQQAMGDPWWDDVRMVVDVWHLLNKHKTTHEFCQKHCNPAAFPELLKDEDEGKGKGKGWWFNTSVAEQINVWLGSFHAIVREMSPVRYNFFLDEMVRLHNIEVIANLKAKGH